jgi:hypothetical protein
MAPSHDLGTSVSDQSVLRLLAPLTPMYVDRASPDGVHVLQSEREGPDEAHRDEFERCVLEAIVTVDVKGRVAWPNKEGWRGVDVASATVVGDAMVEITLSETRAGNGSILDGRGRLQLHRGILCGAGIQPGARLAVVRLDSRFGRC